MAVSNRWMHFLLFVCVLVEVLELELLDSGPLHHLWDAIILMTYAYAASRISGRSGMLVVMLFLCGVPWTMDLLNVHWDGADIESVFWGMSHTALSFVLARSIFTVGKVSSVEIMDAVALYIIVGLAFANLYSIILWHHPGALTHASVPAGERPPYGLVLYYSFISQLTVGYGDMAPAHRLTRAVSILQALFGVMYIAILISWFVSLLAASHLNRKP
ncbi:MAG: potassium channel family protein [Verrucomicrobia bacterium]|nr:potassium channel family protein [Verrucomicrobiota bacterium]